MALFFFSGAGKTGGQYDDSLTWNDAKDSGSSSETAVRWYRVRKTWTDSKTQKGAYKVLNYTKKCTDQYPGYKVFDADGKVVYEPKAAEPAVKVSISDLNIRKGLGTGYDWVQFCLPGIYTIVAVDRVNIFLYQPFFLHIGIDISRKIDIMDAWIRLKYLKHYQMKHGSALLSG